VHSTRFLLYLLVGFVLTVLGPAVFSQNDPGPRRVPVAIDPSVFWDEIAQGKDSIDVRDLQLPESLEPFADHLRQRWGEFLQTRGIDNGVMTRELYLEFVQNDRQNAQARRDADGPAEIILGAEDGAAAAPKKEHRPIVYRPGNLPRDLPPWFAQLDRDEDGQVGLYEWLETGRSADDFLKMDANADGLLTPEEVLRFERARKAATSPDRSATWLNAAGGPRGER
jgi:hypothetical protein